jgi:hypothetical protein
MICRECRSSTKRPFHDNAVGERADSERMVGVVFEKKAVLSDKDKSGSLGFGNRVPI